jgi:hypothetical protein
VVVEVEEEEEEEEEEVVVAKKINTFCFVMVHTEIKLLTS